MDNREIAAIINNEPLAEDIGHSIRTALGNPRVFFSDRKSTFDVFEQSLKTAIRDIENDPRGELFRRLIEYGPPISGKSSESINDAGTYLSVPECESCIEFIYSHMINRFKGELAELLALKPCIELTERLCKIERHSADIRLYWGETIKERRFMRARAGGDIVKGGGFAKGADGLIVRGIALDGQRPSDKLGILGVIEVKSMSLSKAAIMRQIRKHVRRLEGGVKLRDTVWNPQDLVFERTTEIPEHGPDYISVMVTPSAWRLTREHGWEETDDGRRLVFPRDDLPPAPDRIDYIGPGLWKITLAWSEEALSQAGYEMTFWYMSRVGVHVYSEKELPKGWDSMTPEEAGYNAIKMMLYYILLGDISERHKELAVKLYNCYCFGYPLGADSSEMLWPEDIVDTNGKEP